MGATFGRRCGCPTTKPIKADFHFSNIIMLIQGDLNPIYQLFFGRKQRISILVAYLGNHTADNFDLNAFGDFDADGLSALVALLTFPLIPPEVMT